MTNEQTRIKDAQDTFYKWCLNNLPVGRRVTEEDVEGIERVRESNRNAREKLFGHQSYVWYLKFERWSRYDCR